MVRSMSRALALVASASARPGRIDPLDMLRGMVVIGCAMALILARQPLPF